MLLLLFTLLQLTLTPTTAGELVSLKDMEYRKTLNIAQSPKTDVLERRVAYIDLLHLASNPETLAAHPELRAVLLNAFNHYDFQIRKTGAQFFLRQKDFAPDVMKSAVDGLLYNVEEYGPMDILATKLNLQNGVPAKLVNDMRDQMLNLLVNATELAPPEQIKLAQFLTHSSRKSTALDPEKLAQLARRTIPNKSPAFEILVTYLKENTELPFVDVEHIKPTRADFLYVMDADLHSEQILLARDIFSRIDPERPLPQSPTKCRTALRVVKGFLKE